MIENTDHERAQKNGGPPTILAAGSAAGESGVSLMRILYREGMHVKSISKQHLISFKMASVSRVQARIPGQVLPSCAAAAGALTILPEGMDCRADADGDTDILVLAIDPGRFSLAAAEDSAYQAQVVECLSVRDYALFDLARTLASECAHGYPEGAAFWNEIAGRFVHGVLTRHSSMPPRSARGKLEKVMLDRIRDYILAHLDEPIDVATLARIAGRSPFHFTRIFTRCVGITPYQYIVHLRLKHATELIRNGHFTLAQIAARTGFADQSHLSRWIRRVHGVTMRQLAS